MNKQNKQNGQAIVLVLTILAVVTVIGFTFLYMSQVQLRGATSHLARLQTKYLAEAGINHAKELIEFDKQANSIDTYDDVWSTALQGNDLDLDNDGILDSQWFYIQDDQGNPIGRYAVLVSDEAGKININTAGQNTGGVGSSQGYSTYEINLSKFFDNLDLDGSYLISDIFDYRYGEDGKPGITNKDDNDNNYSLESDSIDNDADGIVDEANEGVDEPDEFDPGKPVGDDHPFVLAAELKSLSGIDSEKFEEISRFITVSSKDREVDFNGSLRQNINYIKSDNLIKIMLDRGIANAWQKSVNIIDSIDRNYARTRVFKHYNQLRPSRGGAGKGDWTWNQDHFECEVPGGVGTWDWQDGALSDGEYYCFIYGYEQGFVGDVTISGTTQQHMQNAEAFVKGPDRMVSISDGKFSISIQNNEELGEACEFSYIELIHKDTGPRPGSSLREVNGVEAVRINEVMVKPKLENNAASNAIPGGSWVWQNNYWVNSDSESGDDGEGTWTFTDIPRGNYYLRLLGRTGELIGDVEVSGRTQEAMRHGDNFTEAGSVRVSNDRLDVHIQNNLKDKTCYFKGIILSQQPDTEYVELVNISSSSVDLGGWMLETTGQESVTAFIPQGTTISPYAYLILCVDRNDQAQGIQSNSISFMRTWAAQPAVELDFFKVLDRDFDFLSDRPSTGENFLSLKDANGKVVDKVEYFSSQVRDFYSLERSDPSDQTDNNGNSEFDNWYVTEDLSGGTPGKDNNNSGMEVDEFTNHKIEEVNVRNYPVSNVVDLLSVPTSSWWQSIGISDISLMVDALTVLGAVFYPLENNLTGWSPVEGGYSSSSLGEEGVWLWEDINNGSFFLTLKGGLDEALTISYKKADESWQILAQDIIPNADGLAHAGIINIGGDNPYATPDNTLEIKLLNSSSSEIAHFYYLRLDPVYNVYGRININTATREVLLALPGVESQDASAIITNRPFGNQNDMNRGIGDLFISSLFSSDPERSSKLGTLSNLATTRSNVFSITARAQVLDGERIVATQEIKTIIER
ncbi:lamin tail domain-containing protein [Candidatus Omnitrophota bacterium]